MKAGHALKPVILLAIGGLLVSALSWYGWLQVNDTSEPAVYGIVTEVAPEFLTIKNKREEMTVIKLTETTAVFKNKVEMGREIVVPGDFVQVTGVHEDETSMTAETIRLLRPPKDKTAHE